MIVDLARVRDWTVIERLVDLFIVGDGEETSWVRAPVARYLMVCPLPQAETHLRNLKAIDPDVFDRAEMFARFESPPGANGAE